MSAMHHGPPPVGGDRSRVGEVIGISATLTAIALLCLVARLYTRIRLLKDTGWDDAIIVASWILQVLNLATTAKATTYGFGRHLYYLKPADILQATKWNFISNPFALMAVALPRLAIAMFISKVVGPHKRREIWGLYVIAWTGILFRSLSAIFMFAQCDPPNHFWHPTEEAKCWDPKIVENWSIFDGAYGAFSDLVFAVYPATIIFGLQMSMRRKVSISILMALGLLACICAIIRTTEFPSLQNYSDVLWTAVGPIITTAAEINLLIICACIPTFLPLIQQIIGRKDYLSKPSAGAHSNSARNKHAKYTSDSWRQLPADEASLGQGHDGGVDTVALKEVGEGRGSPRDGIRRTTELKTQWEAV